MKKIFTALLIAIAVSASAFADAPSAGRSWTYLNYTALLSPNWAFTVLPGLRYEFSRSNGTSRGTYFYELFAGPIYSFKSGDFTFKFPFWYYYMGYPDKLHDTYAYSHNIEFLPIVEYRYRNWIFLNRVIFHNTFYASSYPTPEQRSGYGLVIREMVQATYVVNKKLSLLLADEPFFGVIEDRDTVPAASGAGMGYWAKGFRLNRVYAGLTYGITPQLSVSPQYVFETNYNTSGALIEIDHYFYLTVSYVMKFFK